MKSKFEFILPKVTIISNKDKQTILNAFDKRIKDYYKTYSFNGVLDPQTQGLILDEHGNLQAMEFIETMVRNRFIELQGQRRILEEALYLRKSR